MSSLDTKSSHPLVTLAGQAARFVVVGLANTVATGTIFYVLAGAMPAPIAYTIAFAIGVGFAVAVTPRFVFLVRPRGSRRAAYAIWYLVVYAIGLGVVYLLDDLLHVDHARVVVLVVLTTAALSFLGGRAILVTAIGRGAR